MSTNRGGVLQRLEDLEVALCAGSDRVDPEAAERGRELIARIGERLRLGADRTVVALVGATGSGKSSLFNALAGMELAEVGVRRPTTERASACVWAAEGADPLLDWLDVPRRQRTNRESVLDGTRQSDLHGLVLLDLPDHDSTQLNHRLEVDRLVELVDLLVWVVDPQKYADEALHAYLRELRSHVGVMLVVLNHIDTLDIDDARACAGDLRRLLDADGLGPVAILTMSARTGAGVRELRSLLAELVEHRGAFAGRAQADVEAAAAGLLPGVAPAEPDPTRLPGTEQLVTALADAAGLPVLVDAVTADYRRRCAERVDWIVRRWWNRLRSDPLEGLGMSQQDEATVRLLTQAETPRATPAQRERVELAVRELTEASAIGLPPAWSQAVHAAAVATADELSDALDGALTAIDLRLRPALWWGVVAVLQILLLAASGIGIIWWLATFVGAGAPSVGGLSAPVMLLLAGVGLSVVLALLARWGAHLGAEHRRARIDEVLHATVSAIAVERVVAPVAAVIIDHRSTRLALTGGE